MKVQFSLETCQDFLLGLLLGSFIKISNSGEGSVQKRELEYLLENRTQVMLVTLVSGGEME